jgi:phosphoenolpyruvate---glycerone phosphotransferase subunit DhaM
MLGLLIVSHSRKIAEGVRDLAAQVGAGQVPIAAVGGLDDGSLGTNAEAIRAAAEGLGGDEVLVLVDLGSAVLSAEMALEGFARPFALSNGPLVEGAVLAAVEASIGADLAKALAAAEAAASMRKVQSA